MAYPDAINALLARIGDPSGKTLSDIDHADRHDNDADALEEVLSVLGVDLGDLSEGTVKAAIEARATTADLAAASLDASGVVAANYMQRTELSATYVAVIGGSGPTTNVELQAAIDAAPDGGRLIAATGSTWALSAQVAWSSKKLHLDFSASAITEAAALTVPLIKATSADGSSITRPSVIGAETNASFDGSTTHDRVAIEFINSADVVVREPFVSGKSYGVRLTNCTDSKVIEPDIQGFADVTTVGANYHAGVVIIGGARNDVTIPKGRDLGSVVLGGSDTARLHVIGGSGTDLWDNGVYVSSGTWCSVIGFDAKTVVGSGVKVRGAHHTVNGCSIDGATVGISATGNGTTIDALGANGGWHTITGNNIANCTQDGISFGAQDGFNPRQVVISHNTLRNTATGGGGFAAIRGAGHDAKVTNNTIDNCDGTTGAIVIGGTAADPWIDMLSGVRVSDNDFFDIVGDAIRLTRCTKGTHKGNLGRSVTGDLLDLRTVTATTVEANEVDTGVCVRSDAACGTNRYIWNKGDNGAIRAVINSEAGSFILHQDVGAAPGLDYAIGSMWLRDDGGSGTTQYVKEAAGTTWALK